MTGRKMRDLITKFNLIPYLRAIIIFLIPLQAALHVSAAHAEKDWDWQLGHDYYDKSLTVQLELLHNVEKYHLNQGIEKLREHRYDAAMADFIFMLRYFPNHPKALLHVSEVCIKTKKIDVGKKLFEKAIAISPGQAPTYVLYGIYLHKIGEYEKAAKNYNKALEIEPDSAETHYNLGLAYLKVNKLKLAEEHAAKAYNLGFPLPGLRDKLIEKGVWRKESH